MLGNPSAAAPPTYHYIGSDSEYEINTVGQPTGYYTSWIIPGIKREGNASGWINSWAHQDHLGSNRIQTFMAGGQANQFSDYRPFGDPRSLSSAPTSAILNGKAYIDERYDAESGLQYLHARYYDSLLGLFTSADVLNPLIPGVGTNRYAYVGGDPVNYSDPSGMSRDDWDVGDNHLGSGGYGSWGGSGGNSTGNYQGSHGYSDNGTHYVTNCSNCFPDRIDLISDGAGGLNVADTAFNRAMGYLGGSKISSSGIKFTTTGLLIFDPLIMAWRAFKLPPAVTVAMVQKWIAQAIAARILPINARLAFFYSRYADFLNGKIFSGGPWDIKKYGWKQYQALGNALFGYLGSAMGFGEAILRAAAGATQSGGVFDGGGFSALLNGYLGDAAEDYGNVSIGINSWEQGIDPTDYLK